jgi:hypothetical protein
MFLRCEDNILKNAREKERRESMIVLHDPILPTLSLSLSLCLFIYFFIDSFNYDFKLL